MPNLIEPGRIGLGIGRVTTRSYFTSFSATEAPISENGVWASRSSSRTLVNTANGIAFGTQPGIVPPPYNDSYAYLVGGWSPDTEAIATVSKGSTGGIQEIEFLFRLTDSIGGANVTCYEINIAHDGTYANCYAWQGPDTSISDFRDLNTGANLGSAVADGWKFKARCQGNVITLWVDRQGGSGWQNVFSVTDTAGAGGGAQYLTGNPGIGFYRESGAGAADQFGWSDYFVTSI